LFVVLLHRQEIMTRFISPGLFVSWFIVLTLLWIVIGMSLDIYDLTKAADQGKSVWRSAGAAVVTVMVFLCIPILTPVLPTRRVELFSLPLFAALGISAWRAFYAHVLSRVDLQRRALIIGAGWCGRTLAQALAGTGSGGQTAHGGVCYHVLGFIDDDPAKQGQVIAGVPVLGMHHELARLSHELHPDELVFAITHTQLVEESLMDAVLRCREAGMEVTTMSSFYEALTGRVPVEHAGRMLEVVMPVSQSALDRLYLLAKLATDIGFGLIGCLFLLVVMPPIWLANLLTDRGHLFFTQSRVGQAGRTFMVMKFRSMKMEAEKQTGAVWAQEKDPRITPLGRVLRKTRLDELPQFWNVLRGEMSLVGPRPERPEFVSRLSEQIPFYRARHAVKPGITGWAQVKYRYGASQEDALIKLQYDLYYIKHQSLFLDLVILLKTIQVVLGFKGR
jgi:exopolysaccharide biosynthesis polyprenyl glycosylphosphotransferase